MSLIRKESGETAVYDPKKLYNSLEKSGANEELINEIIHYINDKITEGMTTAHIHKMAFKMLKKRARYLAARYDLKKAIMQLGPSGYPFEKFFGEMLRTQGYQVDTNLILKGFCVNHEVDVVASKENKRVLVECKYHNRQGVKSNVKTPLYFKSRFMDLLKEAKREPHKHLDFQEGWLVTNTSFSADALQFGNCAGIKMISWSHPKKGSIKDRITLSGVYPITCLTTLTSYQKKVLIENEVVLCKHLLNKPQLLDLISITEVKRKTIINECVEVCENGKGVPVIE